MPAHAVPCPARSPSVSSSTTIFSSSSSETVTALSSSPTSGCAPSMPRVEDADPDPFARGAAPCPLARHLLGPARGKSDGPDCIPGRLQACSGFLAFAAWAVTPSTGRIYCRGNRALPQLFESVRAGLVALPGSAVLEVGDERSRNSRSASARATISSSERRASGSSCAARTHPCGAGRRTRRRLPSHSSS